MAAFLDNCRFNPTLGGTTDWTYSSAVAGYQSPASAGAVNTTKYKYFAIDASNNWELGEGAWTTSGGVLARTTIVASSTGSKISFAAAPQVAIVAIKEDMISVEEANSFTAAQQAQARANIGVPSILRGYISGLTLSNDAVTPNTILDIAAGVATDDTFVSSMSLASNYTKTTGVWAVGTTNGALDTGTIGAASWYHVFLIQRSDTGVVDILFSLSATAPTMPTNYNRKRRIGSFKTASSNIVAFSQSGTEFLWSVPALDINATNPGTTAVLATLSVPSGVQTRSIVSWALQNSAAVRVALLVTSPDQADTSPGAASASSFYTGLGGMAGAQSGQLFTRTNSSGQVRYRLDSSSSTVQLFGLTFGWMDNL